MKNEAERARKLRLEAANRLIRPPEHVLRVPKKPQQTKARRMAPPLELHIEAAIKVAGA